MATRRLYDIICTVFNNRSNGAEGPGWIVLRNRAELHAAVLASIAPRIEIESDPMIEWLIKEINRAEFSAFEDACDGTVS
jgi:hypothetical protein